MDDARYYKRVMERHVIPSAHLGRERKVTVYLPPGYDERIRYPAVYCQDGDDFFRMGRIATIAQRLMLDEGLEPFLIVGVNVEPARRTDEYAPEGRHFREYVRFFAEELVPRLEDRYSLIPSPDGRVVAGDSLGGTASLHLCLDYPDVFRRLLAFSGAFFATTRERIAREDDLSRLEMVMIVGQEEIEVRTDRGVFDFLAENRATRALLERKKAGLSYKENPAGKHLWGFWQNELPDALRHFFRSELPPAR